MSGCGWTTYYFWNRAQSDSSIDGLAGEILWHTQSLRRPAAAREAPTPSKRCREPPRDVECCKERLHETADASPAAPHACLLYCSQSRLKRKNRLQNDQGQPVDLYIPRKCSWTNRLIGASDQASVQINVGTIDPNTGLHTGGSETYALSGYVRNKGESDMALTELVRKADEGQQ